MTRRTALSFDVGIKNLAYCMVSWSPDSPERYDIDIDNWGVLDISARTIPERGKKMLDLIAPLLTDAVDVVVIERQPGQSTKMRGVSYMIFMHFLTVFQHTRRHDAVHFISPVHKLKVYKGPEIQINLKNAYAKRKRLAVEHCKAILTSQGDPEELAHFMQHDKKDDLADSFLQGAYFLSHENDTSKTKRKTTTTKKRIGNIANTSKNTKEKKQQQKQQQKEKKKRKETLQPAKRQRIIDLTQDDTDDTDEEKLK